MTGELNKILEWLYVNRVTMNVLKTEFISIGSRRTLAALEGSIVLLANGVS